MPVFILHAVLDSNYLLVKYYFYLNTPSQGICFLIYSRINFVSRLIGFLILGKKKKGKHRLTPSQIFYWIAWVLMWRDGNLFRLPFFFFF